MKRALEIGVVGGSIAGCSAAMLLERAGHRVHVFERSRAGLVGRGGGIATPTAVFDELVANDVVDADMPRFLASRGPMVVRTHEHPELGVQPWTLELSFQAFHWTTLWNQLRKRVRDERYHRGQPVAGARDTGDGRAALELSSGESRVFDLVLFADGYRSTGRSVLFPEATLDYRGYMLWRGLLPEAELPDSAPLEGAMPRVSFTQGTGNFVGYFVPGADESVAPGRRLCNWAAYIALPEAEVDDFMIDREGQPQVGAIPPGRVRPEEEARLKAQMVASLPGYYGDLVGRTRDTFVQLIYTSRLPGYHRGRLALIGDAGVVAQPFTGSGVFKGYNNVKSLLEHLDTHDSVDEALAAWDGVQVALGDRLLALGEQMERAFLWAPLDLARATAAETEAWWRASVKFPDDFDHEARRRKAP